MVAWWLLLLLGRILTPESAMLSLHAHGHTKHTTVGPTQTPASQGSNKALLTPQHQHCAVEQFYDTPFQFAAALTMPAPWHVLLYPRYQPQTVVHRVSYSWYCPALRGPPVG
ncbi:hypothetical protein MUN82_11290 [Hymenobacter aerilatus]|uniref:Uncharacterized protein n=1 Tax=Hymenobacter aerilatus TaxID=2932251 RepID=A0A8T9STI6_9BACT|nr:hypothetical protein [Hymenobacter aerilatus]UOR03530.1 hypothetical protein MUN82_11290 [Hymenobacter aerilatus]